MPSGTENSPQATVLYAGGTIGSVGRPLAPLPGPAFAARLAGTGLFSGPPCRWTERTIDSAEAVPADWLTLARAVAAIEGPAVILHGTDTLAWSAAALAFLLTGVDARGAPVSRWPHPVVLTGSMRPLFGPNGRVDPESDAPANLAQAIRDVPPHPEVLVAFAGELLRGARVYKRHSHRDKAFSGAFARPPRLVDPHGRRAAKPALPALPRLDRRALEAGLGALAPHLGARVVLPLVAAPGSGAAEVLAAAATALGERLGAVHLLGYGLGTFPEARALGPVLGRLARRGVVIVAGTQVPRGGADPGLYGSGAWLAEAGAVSAGRMAVPATQAKLHLALALAALHGWKPDRTARFLARPVAGEG